MNQDNQVEGGTTADESTDDQPKTKSNAVVTMVKMDNKLIFTVKDIEEKITFDMDKASAENRARAVVHGFKQRISDGAALSANAKTGEPATPEAKFARMKALADHYMSGATEWALRVAAPRAAGFDAGFAVRAIIHAGINKATTPDDVEALVALTIKTGKATDREGALKFWATTDKVIAAMTELKAAAAPKGADDTLAEMLKAAE